MKQYITGTLVALTGTFRDVDGVLADPTTVTAKVRLPDQTETEPTPVRLSPGVYRIEVTPEQNGLYEARIEGDGEINAAGELSFTAQTFFPE